MFRKFVNRLLSLGLIFILLGGTIVPSLNSVVFADDDSSVVTSDEEDTGSDKSDSKKEDSKKDSKKDSEGNEKGAKSDTRGASSDGSANSRVSTYINFAEGKTLDSALVKSLNTEQLRFMGVFLSNFYTPWMTDLGSGSDKTSKAAQEAMQTALKDYAGFDETTAKTFANYLQGITRASAQKLTLRFKGKQSDAKTVDAPKDSKIKGKEFTYADLLLMASGYVYEHKKDPSFESYGGKDYGEGDYRYGYLGFENSDGFQPVFSFDTQAKDNTASMVAFLKAMEMVDTDKGYGFAALDFKDKEIDVTAEGFKKLLETVGEKNLQSGSIYGAPLKVSAFGDIIWMGANHQYVILPGAMNPFTWQRTDKDGKDYGKAGNALNVANAQMLAHIGNNSLGSVNKEEDKKRGTFYELSPQNGDPFPMSKRGEVTDLRLVIGSSVTDTQHWGDTLAGAFGNNSSAQDKLGQAIKKDFLKQRGLDLNDKTKFSGEYNSLYDIFRDDSTKLPTLGYSDGKVNVMGGLALLDSSGSYGSKSDTGDSSEDSYGKTDDEGGKYNLVQKADIINEAGDGFESAFGSANVSGNTWGNSYKETKDQGYAKLDSSGTAKTTWKYLYTTYLVAGLTDNGKFAGGDYLGYRINYPASGNGKNKGLPDITGESINLSKEDEDDSVTKAIRDWLYYLLHPTDGFKYFVTWITNKIKAFIIGWHNDMAGTEGVGVLPGTTKYIGFSGYVTTPELQDMSWTNAMLNWYKSIIIYLIIGIFVIMMAYTLLGILTFQKSILGLVLFSVLVYTPIIVVTQSVNLSNRFANFVFGDKFAYWGIVQQQSYFADLADSIDSSNSTYKNYLLNLYNENAKESGNQGGDNIVLRWQAPKKMANLVMSKNEENIYSDDFKQMIQVVTGGKNSVEHFTGNTSSTYLYRSYTDIANVSMFMYGDLVSNGQAREGVDTKTDTSNTTRWSKGLKDSWANFTTRYTDDRKDGYGVKDSEGSTDGSQAYRVRLPLAGNIYSDAADVAKQGTIKDLTLGKYVGIDQRMFKFSIAQLNSNQDLVQELSNEDFDATNGGTYTNEDIKSLAAYGVMSENPFYYFSWNLYDQGLASNPNPNGGFKDLLLSKSDSGYFYNVEHNNEMRDYLDMRTLFTYVIPYLKQGNDLVREWDKTYGIFFYDGVTYEEGHEKDEDITSNPELAQKYWHNVNVARLYNIYTPWVDLMYDASYAKQEKISFQGKSYTISDPIDPASYPKERPMVFSKSEMYDYGLTEDQLTSVERKIMNVSEKTMKRWFDLLNYYNFTDVALNTSASMEAAFIFNQEFSQTKLLGDSINLYPQSFELKNFTYDAFLRMIIANSTGESLTADEGEHGSVYERVMKGSSLTTGIFLLILDVLAIYVIPLLKVAIIIAMFISAIMVIIYIALSVNEDIGKETVKKVAKSVFLPAIKFLAVSIAMSWSVSLFMGKGSTAVTGDTGTSIVLGDPAMTLFAMVVLNAVVFVAYWKVFKSIWGSLQTHGKALLSHIGGVLGGAALVGAASLGIGGAVVKSAAGGVAKATKATASGVAKASQAIDDRVGVTKKGASRAHKRAEEKARLREERKALWRERRESASQRYSNFNSWLKRNKTKGSDSGKDKHNVSGRS